VGRSTELSPRNQLDENAREDLRRGFTLARSQLTTYFFLLSSRARHRAAIQRVILNIASD